MREQITIQSLLRKKLHQLRARNSAYSVRAFSKKLGISSGALSELLNGQRRISLKLAERIAERLLLDPQERMEILSLFPKKRSYVKASYAKASDGSKIEADFRYLQLSADQFKMIADWQNFAILSLARTEGFQSSAEWIAHRLGIGRAVAEQSLERLKRLGLLVEDEKGNLRRSSASFRTTDDIKSLSIQQAHLKYLEKAQEALEEVPVHRRDFTAMTLAIRPDRLAEAKERIRKFQDELAEFLEESPRREVYQLCMQLFPLSGENGEAPSSESKRIDNSKRRRK